jgi:hypothetical protein
MLAADLLNAAEEGHVLDTFPTMETDRDNLLLGYHGEETIEVVVVPNIEGEEVVGPPVAPVATRFARRVDSRMCRRSLLNRTLVAEARVKFGLMEKNAANTIIVRRFVSASKSLMHKDIRITDKPQIISRAVCMYFTPAEFDLVEAEMFRLDRFKDLWYQLKNGYGIMRGCCTSPC